MVLNYKALLDTEAETSIIHKRVFKVKPILKDMKINLQIINGTCLRVNGDVTINFQLGWLETKHGFQVVNNLNRNIILGRD